MRNLTHDEAIARAAAITVDGYTLDFDLTRGERTYRSSSRIAFTVRPEYADTFVDVISDHVVGVELDGKPLEATIVDGRLALDALSAGPHEVVVVADMAYTNTGQFMHRFVDPADGETYTYAAMSLEAGGAVYACFDQPDLKAPYTVTMTVDPGDVAIANGAGTETEPGRWTFTTTKPLATYFTVVAAGPYHRIDAVHDGIPISLYARASLAAQLEAQAPEILAVIAACFDRFHDLFGIRYAFGKYDQVFVPELGWGAMEGAGCVTFRDEYVFTSAVTEAQREDRAVTIAHEIAHMWFGDLVTMRWWDDLWLNESFADYLGNRVAAEATAFTGAWTTVAIRRKAWGYAADQRPSTHPVAPLEIADTGEAFLNFDGISYAKGSAVLRQLATWLGDDVFIAGLRAHIAAHAYGNATLADLLGALGEATSGPGDAAGRDLNPWAQAWLRTAQVSTLRPDVRIDAQGRYESVTILQSAPVVPPADAPVLRPHRIRVATGVLDRQGTLSMSERIDVDVVGARTQVNALTGQVAGDLLLLNDADLTYAKIRLDDRSAARLAATLPGIGDALTRALVWGAVWDATRDAETPAPAFVELVATVLPSEPDVAIFEQVLGYATTFAVDRFLASEDRPAARRTLAEACRTALAAADPGSGRQLVAARGLISCIGPADLGRLRAWLDDNRAAPDGLADRRRTALGDIPAARRVRRRVGGRHRRRVPP